MMYFLDFDRTLFNTDAFIEYLKERDQTRDLSYEDEVTLARTLNEMAESDRLGFSAGELTAFLYADVAEFLRGAGNEATIITYGNEALQKIKIQSAFSGIPRISVFYTGEVRKGNYLAPRLEFYGKSLLVDDTPLELHVAAEECPTLTLFQMDRNGTAEKTEWSLIQSLSQLP